MRTVELIFCVNRMAAGLGLTPEEWEELKGSVDDSFWVMRVMGSLIRPSPLSLEIKLTTQGIHRFLEIATKSPWAHTSPFLRSFPLICLQCISCLQGLRLSKVWPVVFTVIFFLV